MVFMKKIRIAFVIILVILAFLLVSGGALLLTLKKWNDTGVRPFKDVITDVTVERITVRKNAVSEEIELKPGSQAFTRAWLYADSLTVYLPPHLFFNLPQEIIYGEYDGIITYYLMDGSVHTIEIDGTKDTAPQQTEYFIVIDGERHYIKKEQHGFYYLKVDGRRYDVKEGSIQSEFKKLINESLK